MSLIDSLIAVSVAWRRAVLALVGILAVLGGLAVKQMTFDALPDLTNTQVQVLTTTPGMAAEEVELLVTAPIERALGGVPGLAELRSVSRAGVSSVTVVFEDGAELWHARQLVNERVMTARDEIPSDAGAPQLAPPTTGLGEVLQFTLRSDRHTQPQLNRVFEQQIAPRLRAVPGVVEVNAWGGGAPQLDIVVSPYALVARQLTLDDVSRAVGERIGLASGGALAAGAEQSSVRAISNPDSPEALAALIVRSDAAGVVRVGDVAAVSESGAMTVGLGSADGEGPALFALVQLLAGADALGTVRAVKAEVNRLRLPEGVELELIYDREKLVGSTLHTVTRSLIEGGLLVVLALLLLLGDLRAGLVVASVIPLAMLGGLVGLWATGASGNLMSLGAVDFGLIVDGTIVVVESVAAVQLGARGGLGGAVVSRAQRVARPVLSSVLILGVVYLPVLLMVGAEGRLFRPMALTVLFALGTALVLTFTYVPALCALVIQPSGEHSTRLYAALLRVYRPALDAALARPRQLLMGAVGAFSLSLIAVMTLGVEFVPRLQEGDIVVQTARSPSLSEAEALREASRVERVLMSFPEVERVASRTGSPAVATDPMGMEEADILVRLRPRDEWVTAQDTEGLLAAMQARLQAEAPGAAFVLTQPIEMRFNELLEGVPSDVGVQVFGQDLAVLESVGRQIAQALQAIPGAADVKAPSMEGAPGVDVAPQAEALARLGMREDRLLVEVTTLRRGVELGRVTRGGLRDAVVLKQALPAGVPLVDLPLMAEDGGVVTLGDVATVQETTRAAVVRRLGGSRRVIVQANVRGRDLGGFVQDARAAVEAIPLPEGVRLGWSGKYEQLQDALRRTALTVPASLALVALLLRMSFGGWSPALLIYLNVPVAASGGAVALALRGLPVSMSALVGFIALFGLAVMNGVVLVSRARELHSELGGAGAALEGALERFRPVVMTAAVAGLGFVPMALATGVGAEVQRPLATVVIGGLVSSTSLTLLVLPALYARFMPAPEAAPAPDPR